LLLVFAVSFPLSAEAVETFGPMHVPIATRGYENLFVVLANRKGVDGSTLRSSVGCISRLRVIALTYKETHPQTNTTRKGKGKVNEDLYSALLRRSGMEHTALPANNTVPASTS